MRYQPSLQTERLRLRPLVAEDAETLVRLAGTPEIAATAISIPHQYSTTAAKTWIAGLPHLYRTGFAVNFAIVKIESKQMIGSLTLRDINRKNANAELEFWIGQPWQRQGYASEALREALKFAFERLELHRIYAYHFSDDQASAQFLIKHGFHLEGTLRDAVRKTSNFQDVSLSAIIAEP